MPNGVIFFMNDETANDTLKEGVCFGVNFGETTERRIKMKPEYIGIGNFDEDNYVYAYCKCPLSVDYAIKWPRIKDGKPHTYTCICECCGTEVGVVSKSYGPEVLMEESEEK